MEGMKIKKRKAVENGGNQGIANRPVESQI